MGGDIGVESTYRKGTTFKFTAVFELQSDQSGQYDSITKDINGKRVLVVDDNKKSRHVLKEQLKTWGALSGEASNGKRALELLMKAKRTRDPYEIVIIDAQMPKMSGQELGRKIRSDADLQDTKLVLMTSLGKRGDAEEFKKIGFSAYLTKPVKQSILYDCLTMIVHDQHPPEIDSNAGLITKHSIFEYNKHNRRILLVEDNLVNQKVALTFLKKLGYSADVTSNGVEAIEALKTNEYALVFMDCQMPKMDGYEATRKIRNYESRGFNPHIPIIALTANAMKGDRDKCINAGMNDYLSKPLNPDKLSNKLKKWLSN